SNGSEDIINPEIAHPDNAQARQDYGVAKQGRQSDNEQRQKLGPPQQPRWGYPRNGQGKQGDPATKLPQFLGVKGGDNRHKHRGFGFNQEQIESAALYPLNGVPDNPEEKGESDPLGQEKDPLDQQGLIHVPAGKGSAGPV